MLPLRADLGSDHILTGSTNCMGYLATIVLTNRSIQTLGPQHKMKVISLV